ncbi:LysM peptidoglycan-binding domain-containing protein [Nocardia sp. NBC_00508]|uniref:CIS tube protein n=1 Tax=Nocardia sp. NBC_00508 TaxID=2975992 RepID=UPI002E7FCBD0|nr:LysM peptidoglycan-binding domain-containing protein [Nocardia sp. NBC_00508]WUD66790.1 LysM peptidoglycan-binding domain-containing protein [Nocardia sp. NBC_00508]
MSAQLAKATIVNSTTGDRIPVMYNPEEYRVEQRNEIAEIPIPGLGVSPVQYVRGQARVLSMDLFFDTYETATDVREHTQRITALLSPATGTFAPPVLVFVMGSFGFTCVLSEADQRFTMFLPNGTPVRARMSVKFTEFVRVDLTVRQGFFVGAPTVHNVVDARVHVLVEGDTVSGLAARYLGDPFRWREIADANGIADPMNLRAGQRITIPGRRAS